MFPKLYPPSLKGPPSRDSHSSGLPVQAKGLGSQLWAYNSWNFLLCEQFMGSSSLLGDVTGGRVQEAWLTSFGSDSQKGRLEAHCAHRGAWHSAQTPPLMSQGLCSSVCILVTQMKEVTGSTHEQENLTRQAGPRSAREESLSRPRTPACSSLLCPPPYKCLLASQAHRAAPVPGGGLRVAPSGPGVG